MPAELSRPATNLGSDWHDIDAVVDHIRRIRGVAKVSLRPGRSADCAPAGYAAQHPDKVHRMVLLAPAYNRATLAAPPALPNPGVVFNTQSRSEFIANWDRHAGMCGQPRSGRARRRAGRDAGPIRRRLLGHLRARAPSTTTSGLDLMPSPAPGCRRR
ncbi:MAG: hypothetical protein R2708_17420 [Vicinamibacterales bacterium]